MVIVWDSGDGRVKGEMSQEGIVDALGVRRLGAAVQAPRRIGPHSRIQALVYYVNGGRRVLIVEIPLLAAGGKP